VRRELYGQAVSPTGPDPRWDHGLRASLAIRGKCSCSRCHQPRENPRNIALIVIRRFGEHRANGFRNLQLRALRAIPVSVARTLLTPMSAEAAMHWRHCASIAAEQHTAKRSLRA